MGCGASKDETGVISPRASKPEPQSNGIKNHVVVENSNKQPLKPIKSTKEPVRNDFIAKQQLKPLPPVQKSIAFNIDLDGKDNEISNSAVFRKPPPKLSRLAPLEGAPTLTADMLQEKLKTAEDKRLQQIELVREKSRIKSRKAKMIQEARNFDVNKLDNDLKSKEEAADKKRLAQLENVKEKQRIREERRQRILAKKKRMQSEEDADIDVEKDTEFQKDDDEPWEFDEKTIVNDKSDGSDGEDDWLGHASPRKIKNQRDSGNGSTRGFSASTVDSFDPSFQKHQQVIRQDAVKDDFFDS